MLFLVLFAGHAFVRLNLAHAQHRCINSGVTNYLKCHVIYCINVLQLSELVKRRTTRALDRLLHILCHNQNPEFNLFHIDYKDLLPKIQRIADNSKYVL